MFISTKRNFSSCTFVDFWTVMLVLFLFFSFMLLDWLSKKMKPHDEQFSIYIKTQFYKSKYYINFHKSNLDIISSLNNTYLGFRKKIENKRNNILNFMQLECKKELRNATILIWLDGICFCYSEFQTLIWLVKFIN